MCTKHFVTLQEGCGTCSKPLDYFSFIQQSCMFCQSPLNRLNIEKIHCDIFSNSQLNLIKTLIFKEKSVIFNLEAKDYIELIYASFRFLDGFKDLTGFSQDTMDIFHNQKYKSKSSTILAIAFSNADWMYTSFASHFYFVLDLFLAKFKYTKRYDSFLLFEKIVKRDCFAEIREAFHQYCIQKLESGVIRRDFGVFKEEPQLLQKRKIIRREEVKIEKGVTYGKMFRLAKNNLVQMNQSNKNEYYVDQNTLDMYLKEEKRWITKKEAGLILGIHAASLESLIRANLFEVSLKFSGKSKRINLDEVKELVTRCRGELVKVIPSNYISFHEALIKYTIHNLSIVSLIQLILSGVIIPVRQNSEATLRDIYLENDKLHKCLIDLKVRNLKEQGYFFSDLLKVFKIGEKRLRRLLKEHNILPDIISHYKDGRARFLYKETSKLRIQEVLVGRNSNKGKYNRFKSESARFIENEILMHLRSLKKTWKGVSLHDPIETDKEGNDEITLIDILGSEADDVVDAVQLKIEKAKIYKNLEILDDREKEVVVGRFDLELGGEERTLREIAKELGISRSYVFRIEKRALMKLYQEFYKAKR
ncbi:sigma-70 family RNA polymerase sigma factor [Paenibacillus sp. Soil750]|uniref:sigma-70 family RNA polymerase sigma factor n=1 Tax=Paenibacillus sp. Soil750 TaxID=1736398 RepID=UPI003FA6F8C7